MNHYQYYIINSHFKKTLKGGIKENNKFVIEDEYSTTELTELINLADNTILDIYIFGYTINKQLYTELKSYQTVESLCTEIDNACVAKNINRNLIKVNILYVSQLRTFEGYSSSDKLTAARVDDFFKYLHPNYATIVKIFLNDCHDDIIAKIFPMAYAISEPLSMAVCAALVKDKDIIQEVSGMYRTPNFESFDRLRV